MFLYCSFCSFSLQLFSFLAYLRIVYSHLFHIRVLSWHYKSFSSFSVFIPDFMQCNIRLFAVNCCHHAQSLKFVLGVRPILCNLPIGSVQMSGLMEYICVHISIIVSWFWFWSSSCFCWCCCLFDSFIHSFIIRFTWSLYWRSWPLWVGWIVDFLVSTGIG